jgi:hypothetical protein
MAKKSRIWNHAVFGNQDKKLLDVQNQIQKLEGKGEVTQLTEIEMSDLSNLMISQQWQISKNV